MEEGFRQVFEPFSLGCTTRICVPNYCNKKSTETFKSLMALLKINGGGF